MLRRHGRPHPIPGLSSGGDGRGRPAPSPASAAATGTSVLPGGAPHVRGGRAGLRVATGISGWPTSIYNGGRSKVVVAPISFPCFAGGDSSPAGLASDPATAVRARVPRPPLMVAPFSSVAITANRCCTCVLDIVFHVIFHQCSWHVVIGRLHDVIVCFHVAIGLNMLHLCSYMLRVIHMNVSKLDLNDFDVANINFRCCGC
jgi:hypothetical protein